MRTLLRWLRRLGMVLLLLLVIAGGVAVGLIRATLPASNLTAEIPGLSAPVTVTLDEDGVPRIAAANRLDAAAALGFLHARERMFQMDLMRRATAGTLAALVGPAALPNDELMRTLGVRRAAARDLAHLPAATRAMLAAYSRGVNAWIARRGRFAALEYLWFGRPAPWTPLDCLLWGKAMGLYLSGNFRSELARAEVARRLGRAGVEELWPAGGGSGHPQASLLRHLWGAADERVARLLVGRLPRFPDLFTEPEQASNEWAVDGAHSTTGAPLLAGDPHLGFGLPGIWYLARIDTPHQTLAGATAPGVPFLVIGRNRHIAWTFTTTGAHVQDLFVEQPAGDGMYATPDGPRPYTVRHETIAVAGAAPVLLTVRESRHGPIVSDLLGPDQPPLAVEMANLAPGDTAASGLFALNLSTSVAAAGRAAAQITSPVQNLLVADREHIGLFVTGRMPLRRSGHGTWPANGADGRHDWIGWASGNALPHIVDPPSGRLVNANDRVAPPDFPVWLGRDWFGDWRARRIRELLKAKQRLSPADFQHMQTDTVSLLARDVLPRLLAVPVADPLAARAQALLRGWDGTMALDAPQPLILDAWLRRFRSLVLRRLAVPSAAAAPWPEFSAYALTPPAAHWCGGNCDRMLARALRQCTHRLAQRLGRDPARWRWGREHQAVFANPLLSRLPLAGGIGVARIPAPGDDTTIDAGGIAADPLSPFADVHGPAYRGVYDLADLNRSRFVVAPGQSGNPFSRFATNFLQRWRDGMMVQLRRRPAKITGTIMLEPRR
ncbi:MAG: penicillin acylase family protein [Rhodospirillales bacterium]|nr:penicillin acylase family protein [Rhodospirillales bacterium]